MQQVPLLQTKLYIPPVQLELLSRPRLIERLNAGLPTRGGFPRALTVISAPAGFGKTTLVSEWVGTLRLDAPKDDQVVDRTAWLSLDESDNDPARFLAYTIAALQTVRTNIGQGELSALQSPQPPPVEAVLTSLINEIAAIPGRIILVLDDYHLIEAQPIHDIASFLLEHLPPQMHQVIATREDPQLAPGPPACQGPVDRTARHTTALDHEPDGSLAGAHMGGTRQAGRSLPMGGSTWTAIRYRP